MNSTKIPNEIISKIVEYVSENIGFDYRYHRYKKSWGFSYNKSNKIVAMMDDLITNKWYIRKYYDMSKPENKKFEKLPNFKLLIIGYGTNPLGLVCYTPVDSTLNANTNTNTNIKVSIFTTVNGHTTIGLFRNKFSVENMFYKIFISCDK
jgi:hypothetical protein